MKAVSDVTEKHAVLSATGPGLSIPLRHVSAKIEQKTMDADINTATEEKIIRCRCIEEFCESLVLCATIRFVSGGRFIDCPGTGLGFIACFVLKKSEPNQCRHLYCHDDFFKLFPTQTA